MLSKSKFVAGYQCPKLLWKTVHEPDAEELQPTAVLNDLFNQGHLVGARARLEWPTGHLIDGDYRDQSRVPRTRDAIAAGQTVLFEACFEQDGLFCAVDVLENNADGWTLIEVKSSSEVKAYHYPDLALQVWVTRRAGLDIRRVEVMHLNRDFRHPDQGALLVRADVTDLVEPLVPDVPERARAMIAMLAGPEPDSPIGESCWFRGNDKPCVFFGRCWPRDTDHIRHLWNVGPVKTMQWMKKGVHRFGDLPKDARLNVKQLRQLRALREDQLIVEAGLREAMQPVLDARHLGYLDFEAVMRAIPAWDGMGPWRQTPAQFSYHEKAGDGRYSHAEFLAEGPENPSLPPDDPREPLALAMLAATANADRIVVYSHYEATRIKELAEHLPHLREPLLALKEKLFDLKPPIENNVYHPAFGGSFSLKDVLQPLVPDLSYDDLVIVDGRVASVEIARLLFVSGAIPLADRATIRRNLLEYCKRDTFATVRLVERLSELAGTT